MVQKQVFLMGEGGVGGAGEGGWHFSYLFFFKVYHLQSCVMHLKKNYFFLPLQFYDKKSFQVM